MEKLLNIIAKYSDNKAIIWKGKCITYNDLIILTYEAKKLINYNNICSGDVVGLVGDYTPKTISIMFALIDMGCIIVPLVEKENMKELLNISHVQFSIEINNYEKILVNKHQLNSTHYLYKEIQYKKHSGLVLFTSGTSGTPKAAVHDFSKLFKKFEKVKKSLRTINFLLFDHWGGLNTMFHIFSNGGLLISTKDRSPANICQLIEKYKIELLPVSPTFLNLLIISHAYKKRDLSSLKIISYGTEPMPENTLKNIVKIFPKVKFLQTYGLIELGVMNTKSESNSSLWVKLGGDGYKTRVSKGLLEIKADSAMLGYLNASSPFTKDGWFKTGDAVEVKGDYYRIKGRNSEIINIGGEKLYPQEVENIIMGMENVEEVLIYSEKNYIIGDIVCAKIKLYKQENHNDFRQRLKGYCKGKLSKYKIPIKIKIVDDELFSDRYKKTRFKD